MLDLKTVFPKASKSFLDANPISPPSNPNKTRSTASVARRSPYSEKMLMNKTESEYAQILESMKLRGEILRYEFEGITLRWFDMRYTPDFMVIESSAYDEINDRTGLRIKFIEVKGAHIHYSQQAMARFKGARGFWPEFRFELHQKTKDGWKQLI